MEDRNCKRTKSEQASNLSVYQINPLYCNIFDSKKCIGEINIRLRDYSKAEIYLDSEIAAAKHVDVEERQTILIHNAYSEHGENLLY